MQLANARRKSFSSDMPSAAIIQKLTIQIPGPDPDELLGVATAGEPSTVAQLLADTWPASGLLDDALVLACTGGHMDVALQLILHGAAIDPVIPAAHSTARARRAMSISCESCCAAARRSTA